VTAVTRGAWARPGTSLDFRTGNWRDERPIHVHRPAPCHAACPAGEDVQAWIAHSQRGDTEAAWRELVSANPLPAITGRVCPHPCEQQCNRGRYDEPVAIHSLERYLGDAALSHDWALDMRAPAGDGPRVAVVGAGPAGISAAYHLRRGGARPVILDAAVAAGGLLRAAIPMTRLPREVLDAELERTLAGMEVRFQQRLGRDFSLVELSSEFDAVFLGPGCQRPKEWSVDGATPPGLRDGLELLKLWVDHGEVPVADRVVVHGGGNTAMDIARIVKRHGAREVHLVTASGLPGSGTAPGDVINVVPRELAEGIEEGIEIHPHSTVQRLMLRGSRLVGVELASLRKLPGEGGRSERVPFAGTERVLEAEMVIPCVGERVDPAGLESMLGGADYLDGRPEGSEAVYAGGDACGASGTVAGAVGDGRRAAEAILARAAGRHPAPRDDVPPVSVDDLNLHYYQPAPRETVNKLPPAERTDDTEIEGGFGDAAFGREAHRCFSCGNCLACDNCWNLCPDNAVIKTAELAADGSHYLFDYEYCKGCGLCAHECPVGFIQMIPELD